MIIGLATNKNSKKTRLECGAVGEGVMGVGMQLVWGVGMLLVSTRIRGEDGGGVGGGFEVGSSLVFLLPNFLKNRN
jgi:hypothetical protein